MVEFTNAATAAKYESIRGTDTVVHIPGGRKGNGWKGLLSTIPVEQADRLIELNSGLVKLKAAPGQANKNIETDSMNQPESGS